MLSLIGPRDSGGGLWSLGRLLGGAVFSQTVLRALGLSEVAQTGSQAGGSVEEQNIFVTASLKLFPNLIKSVPKGFLRLLYGGDLGLW